MCVFLDWVGYSEDEECSCYQLSRLSPGDIRLEYIKEIVKSLYLSGYINTICLRVASFICREIVKNKMDW